MYKLLAVLLFSILVYSCNDSADKPIATEDSVEVPESFPVWQAVLNDSTGRIEMTRVMTEGVDNSSVPGIIEIVNENNPDINLEYLKTSHDTVYLKIEDAHYLTQQMGTTGASMYMTSLVYNLTELPGNHYVHLDFQEGDHAQPGTFSRQSFAGL
ncbi:MAG TPA: hypothetical protein P5158_09740 [Chitinophagaceae bacterium]|nr:hypothetical protein [Chitinophagaceae bacterium]